MTQTLKLSRKIILGTASLSSKYGLYNKKKFISKNQIKKIFNTSLKKKIFFIDTALNYGNNEQILSNYINNRYSVITKIPKIKNNTKNIEKYYTALIKESLIKNKIKKFYSVLLHSPEQLLSKNGEKIYNTLLKIKKLNLTKKIGISVYSLNSTLKILKKFNLDTIQIPLNILNQDFCNNYFIKLIKRKKIEIHARSIFLQGVLLDNKAYKKKKFRKYYKIFNKIEKVKKDNKISDLELNINFCLKHKWVKKIIIGFNTDAHLKEILKTKIIKNLNYKGLPKNISQSLYDPRKWNK
jgi:aryl-alcohol dehydrogenase-like predicted oxidoreductase